jgi:bifunctional DNA-binding transcriptional regulator/antitoxin component of YhaV-PrlF toxin-antitoxin module
MSRLGMPVPDLLQRRFVRPAHYVVTVVDGHGRIAAMSPLRTLGWKPGTVIAFTVDASRLITATRIEGPAQRGDTAPRREITARGHLNLPLTTRRRADVVTGDRLLIAADTDTHLLWVIPSKTLALILEPYTTGRNQQP